jgi:hypothetical protein
VSETRKHRRRTRRRGRASIRNSTTSPDTIRRAEQMAWACRLRSRGFSYRQIARAMKVGVMTAHDLVMDAISAVVQEMPPERIEMERALQLDRLDALQPAIYRRAVRGDPVAINLVLRLMGMRDRLIGPQPAGGRDRAD